MKIHRIVSAITELQMCVDDSLKDEAVALAVLLKRFVDRVSAAPVNDESKLVQKRRPSSETKNWSAEELRAVGRTVPYSPGVYVTKDDRRRVFHRPDCFNSKYGEAYDLDIAIESKARPCDWCGGVRFQVHPLEQAHQIDQILKHAEEIRRFMLGDFSGLIDFHDAAKIMGRDWDELEKKCRKEAREQLRGVKEDRYFQFEREVNVLRYKEHPHDREYQFKFSRQDCIHYSRKYGPLSSPDHRDRFPAPEKRRRKGGGSFGN